MSSPWKRILVRKTPKPTNIRRELEEATTGPVDIELTEGHDIGKDTT